jgi:hypothetical protein
MNAREKIAPAHGLLIGWPLRRSPLLAASALAFAGRFGARLCWPLRRSPLLDAAQLPHNAVEPSMEAS